MSLVVKCSCGKSLQAKEEAGKRVRCPACGTILVLPAPAARPDDPLDWATSTSRTRRWRSHAARQAVLQPLAGSYAPPKPTGSSSGNAVLWVLLAVGGGIGCWSCSPWSEAFSGSPPAAVGRRPTRPADVAHHAGTGPATGRAGSRSAGHACRQCRRRQWEVQADPPQQPVAWPDQPNLDIPIPAGKDRAVLGHPQSVRGRGDEHLRRRRRASVGPGQQQKAGELQEPVKDGKIAAVSPDGQFLASRRPTGSTTAN